MKTLKDIFLKKDEIIALTKEFGFSSEVRLFCSTSENASSALILILREIPGKHIHFQSPTFLETLLGEMLGCKVDVRPLEAIVMYQDHMVLHSVSIENEAGVTALFHRNAPDQVFFDDAEKPRAVMLKLAREHLSSLRVREQENSVAKNLGDHSVLTEAAEREKKKSRSESDNDSDSHHEDKTAPIKTPSPKSE